MLISAEDVETVATAHGFTRVSDQRDWWDNPIHQTWWSSEGEKRIDVEYGAAPRYRNGTVLEIVTANDVVHCESIPCSRAGRDVLESAFASR